jgi:predicted ATPase/Flp pilus assembly protein TadD
MTPERWQRVKAVFQAALEAPPSEVGALLARECVDDGDLRREVERLLASHAASDAFLDAPPEVSAGTVEAALATFADLSTTAAIAEPRPDLALDTDLMPGTIVDGRYRIEDSIGRGGMGVVYRAVHLDLDRQVAVKVLRSGLSERERAVEALRREARAVAKLRHPGIVRVFDLGTAPDTGIYIVMELLEGKSLRATLRDEGRFPHERAVAVMRHVCVAVHAAHEIGIVHRDLKPENIFLEATAERVMPRVLDFGVAKRIGETEGASATPEGVVLGTPAYMAPEQCSGEAVDARTDVYALGCVLYELVTGMPPFVAESVSAVMAKHITAVPTAPRQFVPDLPDWLDETIMRALAKGPGYRFQTAAEFATSLSSGARGAISARPERQTEIGAQRIRTNLPRQSSSFIGREEQVDELRRTVVETPLVTLVGAAGIGKTRLAIEVAGSVLDAYPDGVWLVELAALTEPSLVSDAIATALGVREKPDTPLDETLAEFLDPKRVLVVLDNCEHVVDVCAAVCHRLLRTSTGLHLLTTSREPLGVAGEVVWQVPPLDVPDPATVVSPEECLAYEAVRLFLDRAQGARPGFEVTAGNAATVAALCAQLDGIPLALELAAARARAISVERIAARLHNILGVLARGARTAPARHQTLRAAIDWSYEALAAEEQRSLAYLSVFVDGWTLDAAEAVCESEILNTLTRFVDKSLVLFEAADGDGRYRMLEPIRQYAAARLVDSGDEELARDRNAEWFARLVERAKTHFHAPEHAAWVARLDADHNNIRAAIRWSLGRPGQVALRICCVMSMYWSARGLLSEGSAWLDAALARADARPSIELAQALAGAGEIAYAQSDFERTQDCFERASVLQRELDMWEPLTYGLYFRGLVADHLGDPSRAFELMEESLEVGRQVGTPRAISPALAGLATLAHNEGDFARAVSLLEQCVELFGRAGDSANKAVCLGNLGAALCRAGDFDRAEARLRESLTLSTSYKDNVGSVVQQLGLVALGRGDLDEATDRLREALALFEELGDRHKIGLTLEGMAKVEAARGHAEHALRLAGAADAIRTALKATLSAVDRDALERCLEPMREALGAPGANEAIEGGRAMTIEQAVRYAMGASDDRPLA